MRVHRHINGPPFPLQYAKRLSGDFAIDMPLVVYGEYSQRRGEIGVAVFGEGEPTPLSPTSLPPKDGVNREYLVSFRRAGRNVTVRIDDQQVFDREMPPTVFLQLAVAGEVEFAIQPLQFDRDPAVELARAADSQSAGADSHDLVSAHTFSQAVTSYPLPAPVAKVVAGAGGRYLLLHFPAISRLGVFDVERGEITHSITLRGRPLIAAGAEHLVVVSEQNGMIARLRLSDLQLEARGQLPPDCKPVDMVMGSASYGPLLVVSQQQPDQVAPHLVSLLTLELIELRMSSGFAKDWKQPGLLRASTNGELFCVSGTPVRQMRVSGWEVEEQSQFGVNVLLPNALAEVTFSERGLCGRHLEPLASNAFRPPAVPATTGPYYLTVGVTSPSAEAEPTGVVALHTYPFSRRVVQFDDLTVAVNPSNLSSGGLRLDERIVFYPPAGVIVLVDPANDKLHLKSVDMNALHAALTPESLLVTSHPPAVATAGEVYRYHLQVLAPEEGAGVEYRLLANKPGMEISREGLFTWTVPENGLVRQTVIIGVRQGQGEFVKHSFTVHVREKASRPTGDVAAATPSRPATAEATAPAEPEARSSTGPAPPANNSPALPPGYRDAEVASGPPPKFLSPEVFGFEIPPGDVTLPENQNVTTTNDDGEGVVAKLYAEIGEHRIVLLPNGKLAARTRDESPLTERGFRPATRKEITDQLTARFPGFTTKATRHFNYVYNTTPNFVTGTSRILETLLPGLRKFAGQQGIKTHDPEVPLVVIMFHTQRQFSLYSKMPDGVLAYYDVITNEIVMHEESPFLKTDPELAFKDTIATIAHEGAHQVLYNIGVQRRLSMWPQWLSEGLAEYLSPTSFGKDLRWKGPGATHDMRMLDLELYFKTRGLETTDDTMIKYSVGARGLSSSGYASAWAITHYLAANEPEAFAAHLREVAQRQAFEPPGDLLANGIIPQNLTLFERHFGAELAEMERKLIEHLKTLPYDDPYAELPHFVAMIEWKVDGKTKREANVFHLPSMATKWLEDKRQVLSREGVPRATVAVRDYANRPIAEREVQRFLRQ